jgi:transposase-like protein
MKKSDVQCLDCGAGYRRIQLDSQSGQEGHYRCLVCNRLLETFDGQREVAYRLTVNPERPAARSEKNCHISPLTF